MVPEEVRKQGNGTVRLQGAFEHTVPAELFYVPLMLSSEGGGENPQLMTSCVVTDELAGDDEPVLTPDVFKALRRQMPLTSRLR